MHRLQRSEGRDQRVLVDLVPAQSETPSEHALQKVQRLRRAREHLGLRASVATQIALPDQGQYLELFSNDRVELARLLEDLSACLARPSESREAARLYADGGQGARDPRTGATIARDEDALAGRLHPLLEARRRLLRQDSRAPGESGTAL